MNINQRQSMQNQPNFCAILKIKTVKNKGFKGPFELGNRPVAKLTPQEVSQLKLQAKSKKDPADRITIKINANTDEYFGGDNLIEKQSIIAITDIGNNLDAVDLSRRNSIDYNSRIIENTSPFNVISKYLDTL